MTVTAGRSTVSPTRESLTMTVGPFLLQRIREAGVGHAFGVPGDYNLELLQQLMDTGTLEWIGTCNELSTSPGGRLRAAERDGRADRDERRRRAERL